MQIKKHLPETLFDAVTLTNTAQIAVPSEVRDTFSAPTAAEQNSTSVFKHSSSSFGLLHKHSTTSQGLEAFAKPLKLPNGHET